jgi:hypothetical protein
MRAGTQCLMGISPAGCGSDCSGAPLLAPLYVGTNLAFNIAALNLLRATGVRAHTIPSCSALAWLETPRQCVVACPAVLCSGHGQGAPAPESTPEPRWPRSGGLSAITRTRWGSQAGAVGHGPWCRLVADQCPGARG